MLSRVRRNSFTIIGAVLGTALGYIYWYNIGCTTGSCPIKSNPVSMTIYGALIGALAGNLLQDFFQKRRNKRRI